MLILPTTYLGPEAWYRELLRAERQEEMVQMEVMESFVKQTYRNRCTILTPDGPLTLSVPVRKVERKQYTRDVEISYQTKWQHQHWMAIMSAYKHTPYFDYYQDYLRPFYERETKYLVDLNDGLHDVVMHLLRNEPPTLPSEDRSKTARRPYIEHRLQYAIQKTTDWMGQDLEPCWGNGLSILDGLFRLGPEFQLIIDN